MDDRDDTVRYQPWFVRYPELLADEEQRFADHKLPWGVDKEAKSRGWLVVHSEVEWKGQPLGIRIEYPSEYPDLPPTIFSDEAILERHQQPFRKNFCLLARPEDDWNAREWSAAELIRLQLDKLLEHSAQGEDVVRQHEEPMPEPQSAHFVYETDAVVLVPGNLARPSGDGGRFRVHQFDQNRYVLARLDGEDGDRRLIESFPKQQQLVGRWKRLPGRPEAGPTGQEVLAWVRNHHQGLIRSQALPPKLRGSKYLRNGPQREVIGLVFPEEATPDGTERDGWMFLGVEQGAQGFLIHAQVTSEEERARRTPELRELNDRKIAVVGAGSLGGELAVEMARASTGALHLMDHDRFEANNAVRHVLGVGNAGRNNTKALADACKAANPFCEVTADPHIFFGGTRGPPPLERLYEVLQDVDLVIETTGVHQLQLVVARAAWDIGTPFISCWLTEGLWGGEVVRLVPGETACFLCFMTRQRNGQLKVARAAPEAGSYPQGCVHPTTSGAGFDASDVVAQAARAAAGMLSAYPAGGWDHGVFNFRPDDEHPRFESEALEPTPDCELCRRDAG